MLPGWRLESNWLKKGKFDSKNGSFISHQGKGKGKMYRKMKKRIKVQILSEKKMRTKNFSFWNNKLVQQFHFPTFSEMLWNRMRGQKISEIIEQFCNIFLSDGQTVHTFTFLTSILLLKVPHFSLEDEQSIYVIQTTSVMLYCTHS